MIMDNAIRYLQENLRQLNVQCDRAVSGEEIETLTDAREANSARSLRTRLYLIAANLEPRQVKEEEGIYANALDFQERRC